MGYAKGARDSYLCQRFSLSVTQSKTDVVVHYSTRIRIQTTVSKSTDYETLEMLKADALFSGNRVRQIRRGF